MKLLNRTSIYLSAAFVLVMGVWAILLYVSMLDEIYDSIDDGLDNQKLLIIERVNMDSSMLLKSEFNESNYSIKEISREEALIGNDRYNDTMMYMQNERDFEPVRILHTDFRYAGNYYQLQVITSMVEEDDLIADLLFYLVILYGLIIICVFLVNNVVLRRIWKPFYGLLGQLKEFDLKNPRPLRAPATRIVEFNDLNDTVSLLLDNNISTFNSQKQFIENASHELQTPLATSINSIELLIEEEGLSETAARDLAGVLKNLERLTRLNRSLILISLIENRQYKNEEPVNLNLVVRQQIDEFATLADYSSITVRLTEGGQFTHMMNKDLAPILVTNLLRNALVYNYRGGDVQIELNAGMLKITNSSHQPPLDNTRIFQRFYRDQSNRNSIGLGLSIARGICAYSGLQIHYSYSAGRHCFTVEANS